MTTQIAYPPSKTTTKSYGLPIGLGIVSILVIILIAPVILNMLNKDSDYVPHLLWAETWAKYGSPDHSLPQFLFQILVVFLYRIIPGISIPYAGLLLAIIYYIALSMIIFVLVYPLFTGFPAFLKMICGIILTLTLMFIGPINLIPLSPPDVYLGYISPHVYHNPTIALLKPFALILFLYACQVFKSVRTSYVMIMACALISTFGTIAKPSYAIVIIPVLGLLAFIYWWRGRPINWMLLIAGIALPIGIVLLWQQRYYANTSLGRFIFAPLLVMSYYSANNLLLKLLLSVAFPLAVLIFYYREALKDISMQIGWLGLIVGLLYTYLLAESYGWQDGNFTWSSQIALLILFVASVIFLVKQNMPLLFQRRVTPAFIICTLLLVLHLIGGIAIYTTSSSPDWLHLMLKL